MFTDAQEWEVTRPDEDNPGEEHYVDLIRVDEVHAKQFELRRAIDDLMRAELEQLKEAVWREKNKSGWPLSFTSKSG